MMSSMRTGPSGLSASSGSAAETPAQGGGANAGQDIARMLAEWAQQGGLGGVDDGELRKITSLTLCGMATTC